MKKTNELQEGDYIAFGFNYHGGKPTEIIVSNITSKISEGFIVHFLYGHSSLSEIIKEEEVIAIGNPQGRTKLKGWGGNFDLLQPEHNLLIEFL